MKRRGKSYRCAALGGPCERFGITARRATALLLALAWLGFTGAQSSPLPVCETAATIRAAQLPDEARQTLALIKQSGPYPFARDGMVFANREARLPPAPRGTYREYTVKTPGRRDRGARRIIAAGTGRFWYTADHYRSFLRIIE